MPQPDHRKRAPNQTVLHNQWLPDETTNIVPNWTPPGGWSPRPPVTMMEEEVVGGEPPSLPSGETVKVPEPPPALLLRPDGWAYVDQLNRFQPLSSAPEVGLRFAVHGHFGAWHVYRTGAAGGAPEMEEPSDEAWMRGAGLTSSRLELVASLVLDDVTFVMVEPWRRWLQQQGRDGVAWFAVGRMVAWGTSVRRPKESRFAFRVDEARGRFRVHRGVVTSVPRVWFGTTAIRVAR